MAKWADYVITAVHFDTSKTHRTHIDSVKVRRHVDGKLIDELVKTRGQVVALIEAGSTFVTAYYDAEKGHWTRGAKVEIVTLNGVKYLKTVADGTTKDNLDNLPEF